MTLGGPHYKVIGVGEQNHIVPPTDSPGPTLSGGRAEETRQASLAVPGG